MAFFTPKKQSVLKSKSLYPAFFISACLIISSSQPSRSDDHPCFADTRATDIQNLEKKSAPQFFAKQQQNPDLRLAGLVPDDFAASKLEQKRSIAILAWYNQASTTKTRIEHRQQKNTKPDRYKRLSVLAFKQSELGLTTLQDHLLTMGLARADPEKVSPSCGCHLIEQEEKARSLKKGLWALHAYKVKKSTALHLSAMVSTYQIVHGKILSLSRKPSATSYLNFGRYWKTDFTVTLSAKNLKMWEARQKSLDDLNQQSVYVRGWIENRDGALIRIKHPCQLSIDVGDGTQ